MYHFVDVSGFRVKYEERKWLIFLIQFSLCIVSAIYITFMLNGNSSPEMQAVLANLPEGAEDKGSTLWFCWLSLAILFRGLLYDQVNLAWGLLAGLLWLSFGDSIAFLYWSASLYTLLHVVTHRRSLKFSYFWYVALWGVATICYNSVYQSVYHGDYLAVFAIVAVGALYARYALYSRENVTEFSSIEKKLYRQTLELLKKSEGGKAELQASLYGLIYYAERLLETPLNSAEYVSALRTFYRKTLPTFYVHIKTFNEIYYLEPNPEQDDPFYEIMSTIEDMFANTLKTLKELYLDIQLISTPLPDDQAAPITNWQNGDTPPFEQAISQLESEQRLPQIFQSELDGIIKYARLIQQCMMDDPNDVKPGSEFLERYLPAITALLEKSNKLSGQLEMHGNAEAIDQQSIDMLHALHSAFRQKHAQLLENDTLAFSTDLSLLNSLLKTDGFK